MQCIVLSPAEKDILIRNGIDPEHYVVEHKTEDSMVLLNLMTRHTVRLSGWAGMKHPRAAKRQEETNGN